VGAVPQRALPGRARGRHPGRQRRALRGQQGRMHLRQLPGEEGKGPARPVHGGSAARRAARGGGAGQPQRLVLAGVCARALQPGHQRRQGAGAGPRQQGQGVAGTHHPAAAPACRRAHRARRLPRGGDRQGRHAHRRHDLRRQEGDRAEDVPGGPAPAPAVAHRADRVRQRPGHAGRRQEDEEATRLYQQAAALQPLDAMERLDVDLARAELDA
jgi:hypothetical protein